MKGLYYVEDFNLLDRPLDFETFTVAGGKTSLQTGFFDGSREWLLKFNACKCRVMQIGPKQKKNYQLQDGIDNLNIEETEAKKDLGVCIDNDLK